ncbi:hypothetical protein AFB00_07100 [Pseudonocardia sp. HH130630-07]|nr:hypothetical protein AFB00_07100 [Pseudonocardia sp. HH130630-07]
MVQISVDNVLRVRAMLEEQEETLSAALDRAELGRVLEPCGTDPVSQGYTEPFQRKIDEVFALHHAHRAELAEAVDRLGDAAKEYGLIEDENTRSFAPGNG